MQGPPGFPNQQVGFQHQQQQLDQKKPTLEDILSSFITETQNRFNKDEARIDSIETHCSNMNATMKSLET